jgi:hypothetical protein
MNHFNAKAGIPRLPGRGPLPAREGADDPCAGNPNMPFWRMLKEGNDHFELTHLEPKVDVCEKRYVFDAEPVGGVANDPTRIKGIKMRLGGAIPGKMIGSVLPKLACAMLSQGWPAADGGRVQ